MHALYLHHTLRFDIKWIKKVTLQTYEKIDKDSDLKEDAKRYLKGIHERSKKGELTKRPSLKDYKALVEAYGDSENIVTLKLTHRGGNNSPS